MIELDTIPTDPLTQEHFGFSKLENMDGEVNLAGLYTGLFFYLEGGAEEVYEWQQKIKLAEGILRACHPRKSGYLAWFKKNQHVVDDDCINLKGPKAPPKQAETLSEDFYNESLGRWWA